MAWTIQRNNQSYGNIKIEYEDYTMVADKTLTQLNNQLENESTRNTVMSSIPHGGQITIRIYRRIIDSANTNNFIYVIVQDGKEIYRKNGSHNVPNYDISDYGTTWWNIDIVYVPKPIEDSITLYVIDRLGGEDEFIIKKQQQ